MVKNYKSNMMKCGIYIIKSKINNRVYIGQSINIDKRLSFHKYLLQKGSHHNKHLQFFCNKYGIKILSFGVVELCPKSLLNEREQYWIFYYNSHKEGFNHSNGGEDNPMNHSKNREAVSRALKGHKKTKEWSKKIVENRDHDKMFNTRVKNGYIKYIYAYDATSGKLLDEGYGFNKMGAKFSLNASNIRQCVNGKLKTVKGLHFSLYLKTPADVIESVKPLYKTEEYRKKYRQMFSGKNNPMYGKKRPDMMGDNNYMRNVVVNGQKKRRNIKLSVNEIIEKYENGVPQKEIAKEAGCSQSNISLIICSKGVKGFAA